MCQMYICSCVCGCVFLWRCAYVEYILRFVHVSGVVVCVWSVVVGMCVPLWGVCRGGGAATWM